MNPNIAKLIREYKNNNNEDTIITLWDSFQPLIYSCMRKYYVALADQEDIKQEAFLQLLQCIQIYDLSKGVPFESYYKMYLHFWFLNNIRKKEDLVVLDHDWENGCSMTDLMESKEDRPEEHLESNETRADIQKALEKLTPKQRKVVTMYYIGRISLVQIAKEMGCSYKVAFKHKDAGMKKLRKIMK